MLELYGKMVVTGGAGFIGRYLVAALLSLGKRVVILDSLSTSSELGVTLVRADIRDPARITEVAKDAELIFHLAANANGTRGTRSIKEPRFDFETNALGTLNVLEAARSGKVKKLVYVSSASVYGKPEKFPIDEDHPTRPFAPYGPPS